MEVGTVIDIGGGHVSKSLQNMVKSRLFVGRFEKSQRVLPSALLSDDRGFDLWTQINRLPSYYQTCDEIRLLQEYGEELAKKVLPECTLIDLGSGDIRKVKPLLDILESQRKPIQYFALDLSHRGLELAMAQLAGSYQYVRCFGLWGTFDDGLEWSASISGPRWFLSLGSSFGNDFFEPAVARLSEWRACMRVQDRMLLGMDAHTDITKIWASYHDAVGLFETFIRNGLEYSNRVMDYQWYRAEDWEVVGVMQSDPIMHRFVIRAINDVVYKPLNIEFLTGDEIDCYEAFKYPPILMHKQFSRAGLRELGMWRAPSSDIYQYLLTIAPSDATNSQNSSIVGELVCDG